MPRQLCRFLVWVSLGAIIGAQLSGCQPPAAPPTAAPSPASAPTVEVTPAAALNPTASLTSAAFDPCAPVVRAEVWEDIDGDGERDPGDPPVQDVQVAVFVNSAPSDHTVFGRTSANGLAELSIPLDGDCTLADRTALVHPRPQGWKHTTENVKSLDGFNPQTDTLSFGLARIPDYRSPTPLPTWTPTVFPPPVQAGLVSTPDSMMIGQAFEDCPYLSRQTAEDILGGPVELPSPGFPTAGFTFLSPEFMESVLTCSFTTPDRSAALFVWVAATRAQAQANFESFQSIAGDEAIPVGGLGSKAFWWPLALRLDVAYLNARLWVSFNRPASDQGDQAAALAAAALERIDASLGQVSPSAVVVPTDAPKPALADLIYDQDLGSPDDPFIVCELLSEEDYESILGPLKSAPLDTSGIGEMVGVVHGCQVNDVGFDIFLAGTPSGAIFTFPPDPGSAPVEGVGDIAWFSAASDYNARLEVVRGNVRLGFSSYRQDAAQDRPLLEALARLVIKRLFERAGNPASS